MTTRISQLGDISTVQGNVLVPLVSNITGNLTTVKGSVDTLKAFIVAATEANIVTANIGMKGYVDSVTTAWTANAGQQLSDLGNLYANASSQQSTLNSLLANAGSQSDLIIGINANVTAANLGMKGYVDNSVSTANIGIIGYIGLGNTIQSNQISAANVGIIGYIDQGNTIQSNQISAANLGMKGYVDSVASQSIYGNGNVTSYTVSMGFTNFSNVNVAALITTNGLTNYSNINLAAYLGGAVNIGGNLTTLNAGNISAGGYFLGNGSQLSGLPSGYSNVQVATYLPTYSGNIANITLGISGVLTFSDGTTMTTAASGSGGSNYSNANVTAYTVTMGFTNFSNVNVAALITTNGLTNYSNVNTKAYSESMGYQNYGNVNVTAYVTSLGHTNFSNVNVAAYLTTGPIGTTGIIYANAGTQSTSTGTGALVVNGGVGITGNLTVGNLTVLGTQTTVSAQSVNLSNSFVFLSNNNITNTVDIGFVGQYNAGLGNVYTGLAYRASDGVYRLFSNVSPQPSLTVNLTNAVYSSLQVGGLNATGNVLSTGLSAFGNTTHGLTGAVSGQFHSFVGNITQSSSGGAVYINTTGNVLATGLSAFGNTTHGVAGSISGQFHTFIGNITQTSSGGAVYFNTAGNLMIGGNTALAGNLTVGTVGAGSGVFHTFVGNITQVTSGGAVGINTTGNISASVANFNAGNVGGFAIGYRDVPQITAANVTLISSDAGKHYYGSNTNPVTLTIPLNSSVAFGNGTAISLVNQGTGNITITPTAGAFLYLAGNTTSGSKTLTSYGMATLLKVQVNTWFINGTGVV